MGVKLHPRRRALSRFQRPHSVPQVVFSHTAKPAAKGIGALWIKSSNLHKCFKIGNLHDVSHFKQASPLRADDQCSRDGRAQLLQKYPQRIPIARDGLPHQFSLL